MPTVLRHSGFSVMIYTRDHEPMHVHVWYQGSEAVIRFQTDIILLEVNGMSRKEGRRALAIINENREYLSKKWREIYGEED